MIFLVFYFSISFLNNGNSKKMLNHYTAEQEHKILDGKQCILRSDGFFSNGFDLGPHCLPIP